jgi:hypothetical protein
VYCLFSCKPKIGLEPNLLKVFLLFEEKNRTKKTSKRLCVQCGHDLLLVLPKTVSNRLNVRFGFSETGPKNLWFSNKISFSCGFVELYPGSMI